MRPAPLLPVPLPPLLLLSPPRPLPDQPRPGVVAAGAAGVALVAARQDAARPLACLQEVQLLLVDAEAQHTPAETGRVPQVPGTQGGLAHVPGQPAHIERPLDPQPLPLAVIEDAPGHAPVNVHGQVTPMEQQLHCVRPVVTDKLVTKNILNQ